MSQLYCWARHIIGDLGQSCPANKVNLPQRLCTAKWNPWPSRNISLTMMMMLATTQPSPPTLTDISSSALLMHVHRRALALNNIGVLLMERDRYEDARQTFKEAIAVLQLIWKHPDSVAAEELLHQLDTRIAAAESLLQSRQQQQDHQASSSRPRRNVHVLVHHPDRPLTLVRRLMRAPQNLFVVRLEVDVTGYTPDNVEWSVEAALLLYNYATSHVGLAAETIDKEQDEEGPFYPDFWNQTALGIYTLAHSALENVRTEASPLVVLQCEAVTLHAMMPLVEQAATAEQADEFRDRVCHVLIMVDALEGPNWHGPCVASAA